jgi:hypothetical protein
MEAKGSLTHLTPISALQQTARDVRHWDETSGSDFSNRQANKLENEFGLEIHIVPDFVWYIPINQSHAKEDCVYHLTSTQHLQQQWSPGFPSASPNNTKKTLQETSLFQDWGISQHHRNFRTTRRTSVSKGTNDWSYVGSRTSAAPSFRFVHLRCNGATIPCYGECTGH